MRAKSREAPFVLITSFLYAGITLYFVLHHEPWRDEADAWLAARDLPLSQLWHWLHYVGSPALWYLMLMPLAKGGAPYISMNMLNWVFGVAVAVLIVAYAPFPKWVRVVLLCSFYLPAEYTLLARPYAAMCLFLVLAVMAYPRRYERPLVLTLCLVLLANIGPHGILFAAALTVAWGLDSLRHNKLSARLWIAGGLACAGIALAAAQVMPNPPDGQLAGGLILRHPDAPSYLFSHTFMPICPQSDGHIMTSLRQHFYPLFAIAWLIPRLITAAFLGGTLYLLRRDPALCAALILSFLGILYVFTFKHFGGDHHAGLLWFFIWMMLWLARPQLAPGDLKIWKWGTLPLSLSAIYCLPLTVHRLTAPYPYTGAKQAAEFLLSHQLADRPLLMYEENRCESILPYLGKKSAWYAGENRIGTYMTWNKYLEKDRDDIPAMIDRMLRKSDQDPSAVLIFGIDLTHPLPADYQLVFDNRREETVIYDEKYAIYVRNSQTISSP